MTKKHSIPDRVKMARKVATPIIAVGTPDQPATVAAIAEAGNGYPILVWSTATGLIGGNPAGESVTKKLKNAERIRAATAAVDALRDATPQKTLLCIIHSQQPLRHEPTFTASLTMNRDVLMRTGKCILLLSPMVDIPDALQHDVMTLNDPLPADDEIRETINDSWEAVKHADDTLKKPAKKALDRAVAGLRGLSAFEVGQASSMSLVEHRALDAEDLHSRRNSMVDSMPGLSVDVFKGTFSDIRGIGRARWFADRLFGGPEAPSVLLRIDELEKKMGGNANDYEGGATKGDELQVLLTEMEDNNWSGVIAYGPPGSGKTLWTRAMGPTHGAQTFNLDLGGTRSKYVGESEQNIRAAMRTVKAIGGERVYVVATCNELDNLKPELKRRFTDGVFFFDLPTAEELADLWTLYRKQYGIDPDEPTPESDQWTGAEVRNACRLAHRLQIPLAEAAAEIIPVIESDPEGIERRRKQADGRFKSASNPGVYRIADAGTGEASGARLIG